MICELAAREPERNFNNIILERTIEYNTYPISKFHGKESNAAKETDSICTSYRERMKKTEVCVWSAHMPTCSSHVLSHVSARHMCFSYGTSFYAVTT